MISWLVGWIVDSFNYIDKNKKDKKIYIIFSLFNG
jgi:hypothetical protein